MNAVRRSNERGHADHGWLDSYHSFSFADYFDSRHVEFGPLRVINEDRVAPGAGFGTHPHRDMEIISYVLSGELAHRDSLGTGSVIRPGDVQRMSAGSGVTHSEFNPSSTQRLHFLQIWIKPNVLGIEPSYEEKHFSDEQKQGRLALIASPDGRDGSVSINQDALLYVGRFGGQEEASLELRPNRRSYVHVVHGAVWANDIELGAGDALKVGDAPAVRIKGGQAAEVLVFDLP
jgi:redox-sensitive bicupin YhaK (pirin superfamily)